MNKLTSASFGIVLALLAGGAVAKPFQTEIIDNDGKTIGSASFQQGSGGVLMHIEVEGLPPGFHGMHFHEVGDCSDNDAFERAGDHVDPHQHPHGFLNPDGPHEGNLPNLIVHADGAAEVELFSQMVSIEGGDAALLDADGSSLIIHAARDDHTSQPIGNSGARIACGVIKR